MTVKHQPSGLRGCDFSNFCKIKNGYYKGVSTSKLGNLERFEMRSECLQIQEINFVKFRGFKISKRK